MLKTSEIRELVRLLDETSVHEIHIEMEDMKLHMKKADVTTYVEPLPRSEVQVVPRQTALPVAVEPSVQAMPTPIEHPSSAPVADEGITLIKSPMVGTFYSSPSPSSPAYVEIGSKVTEKTVVCIVEAMKLMNEIESDVRGEVVEILAENGHLVEYGQPLFRVKLA